MLDNYSDPQEPHGCHRHFNSALLLSLLAGYVFNPTKEHLFPQFRYMHSELTCLLMQALCCSGSVRVSDIAFELCGSTQDVISWNFVQNNSCTSCICYRLGFSRARFPPAFPEPFFRKLGFALISLHCRILWQINQGTFTARAPIRSWSLGHTFGICRSAVRGANFRWQCGQGTRSSGTLLSSSCRLVMSSPRFSAAWILLQNALLCQDSHKTRGSFHNSAWEAKSTVCETGVIRVLRNDRHRHYKT